MSDDDIYEGDEVERQLISEGIASPRIRRRKRLDELTVSEHLDRQRARHLDRQRAERRGEVWKPPLTPAARMRRAQGIANGSYDPADDLTPARVDNRAALQRL
jgi:hypothetical protein